MSSDGHKYPQEGSEGKICPVKLSFLFGMNDFRSPIYRDLFKTMAQTVQPPEGFKSGQNFLRDTALSAKGGLVACLPRKFLNLEALKCQFWCSNTAVSFKNLG